MIKIGEVAPNFSLRDQHNELFSLSDASSKYIVIYFYPKAMTPGCTRQSCAVTSQKDKLSKLGATVIGISADSVEKIAEFSHKSQLEHTLLADEDHEVCQLYGAWQKKNMYGRESWGVKRMTYILDEARRVVEFWPKVDPDTHTDKLIEWLETHRND